MYTLALCYTNILAVALSPFVSISMDLCHKYSMIDKIIAVKSDKRLT